MAAAVAALLAAIGIIAASLTIVVKESGGPDRSAAIIRLSQDELNAMTDAQLTGLHDNLTRRSTATGSINPDTAAALNRINNALITNP